MKYQPLTIRRYRGSGIDEPEFNLSEKEQEKEKKEDMKVIDELIKELNKEVENFKNEISNIKRLKTDASFCTFCNYLLNKDLDSLESIGFENKNYYLEMPIVEFCNVYKKWCSQNGYKPILTYDIIACIKAKTIDRVHFKVIRGNRFIRISI